MTAPKLDLAAIKARRDAATPGPHRGVRSTGYVYASDCVVAKCGDFSDKELVPFNGKRWGNDAEFFAHSWSDVGDLLAEVERLQRERAECARLINCAGPLAHRIQVLLNERAEALNEVERLTAELEAATGWNDWILGRSSAELKSEVERLQREAARLDELERLAWDGCISVWLIDRPVIEITQYGDTSVLHRCHTFREAADWSLSRQPAATPEEQRDDLLDQLFHSKPTAKERGQP